jgi:oligoendopeptidase F
MFAEFEKTTHEMAERGEALTGESLNEAYASLNRAYYPSIEQTELIQYEWMRIPHFYNAFYVYQYATGFSAAMAIASLIREQGAPAVANYLKFLSSGGSLFPIDALKLAGVDMSRPEPVERALKMFEQLLERYKKAAE